MTHDDSGRTPFLPGLEAVQDRERLPESLIPMLRTYRVNAASKQPLLDVIISGLEGAGCRIHYQTTAQRAPFVLVFETPESERIGVVIYAFRATRTPTRNRPSDERSFQVKYSSKADSQSANEHELWFDPNGMFTTVFLGVDPIERFCVSADPLVHSPTKFFIRVEFKDEHAERTQQIGFFAWERAKLRTPPNAPRVETLVGAREDRVLDLIRFERAAVGADPGNRLILAERWAYGVDEPTERDADLSSVVQAASSHPLVAQFGLSPKEIFDLIDSSARLKMAVRGWVAEEHLHRQLVGVPGVTEVLANIVWVHPRAA